MTTTPCPLAHCDPVQCGWRASDASCEWQDQAIDTTGASDGEGGCAHCGSTYHVWDDCQAYTALVACDKDDCDD